MILCDAGVLLCLVDRTQPQQKPTKVISATYALLIPGTQALPGRIP